MALGFMDSLHQMWFVRFGTFEKRRDTMIPELIEHGDGIRVYGFSSRNVVCRFCIFEKEKETMIPDLIEHLLYYCIFHDFVHSVLCFQLSLLAQNCVTLVWVMRQGAGKHHKEGECPSLSCSRQLTELQPVGKPLLSTKATIIWSFLS
jgi:hypothetical protein